MCSKRCMLFRWVTLLFFNSPKKLLYDVTQFSFYNNLILWLKFDEMITACILAFKYTKICLSQPFPSSSIASLKKVPLLCQECNTKNCNVHYIFIWSDINFYFVFLMVDPSLETKEEEKFSLITISLKQSKENSMSGVQHFHMSGVQQLSLFNKALSVLEKTLNKR